MANDITRSEPVMPKRRAPMTHDPRVMGFLNEYTSLLDTREALTEQVADRDRQIEQLQDRVDLVSRELVNAQADRDRYQRGYHDLKAQLTVLATAAVAACKSVIDTATAALDGAENEINGNSRKQPEQPPAEPIENLEAEIARLAATESNTAEQR